MTRFSCIVFDMDGTLTNTNRLIFDAFNHIVTGTGREPMTDAEIVGLFGPPEEGALAAIVGTERVDEAMRTYLQFYRSQHDRLATLHEGIDDLLRALRSQGVRLALFTGKGTHTTAITLEAFRLQDLFEKVVTGNDVVQHKPSGEGIRSVMKEFGVAPDRTLMVGDSVADVRAARDAGVQVASVLWDSYNAERVKSLTPDFVFDDIASFRSWVLGAAGGMP